MPKAKVQEQISDLQKHSDYLNASMLKNPHKRWELMQEYQDVHKELERLEIVQEWLELNY